VGLQVRSTCRTQVGVFWCGDVLGRLLGWGFFEDSYEVAEGLGVVHVFGAVEGD